MGGVWQVVAEGIRKKALMLTRGLFSIECGWERDDEWAANPTKKTILGINEKEGKRDQ